ncbi:hypothetical protein [Luteipulveratus halotolerans]|uniref:Uncharacterized protein n=1 Tax=Luteipulveratus halotolerans TaxID=1631356 RepID=A0A0L6CF61_9MICO|nr:hypothetical protein [Luteipulveratus halotolerans]KNX36153.1 hypothetical protein VV01_01700 [Luteipulveratus halotolerans]
MTRSTARLTALALAGTALAGSGAALAAQSASATTATTVTTVTAGVPTAGTTALGWSAAIRHQSNFGDGKGTLVLVPPTGGIMTMGAVSDDASVSDVSQDARKVLTARFQTGEGLRVTVWDTATRTPTYFRVAGPNSVIEVRFGGDGILVKRDGKIESRTLSGTLVRSYTAPSSLGSLEVSPNGATTYWSIGDSIQQRDAKTGALQKTYAVPTAYRGAAGDCWTSGTWDSTSLRLACTGDGVGTEQTFRLVRSTGQSTAIGPANSAIAFPTSPKWMAKQNRGNDSAIGFMYGSGFVELTGYFGLGSPSITGAYSNLAYVNNFQSGAASTPAYLWLGKYDISTNTMTRLAGAGSSSGGVITQAQTVDGHH